MVSVQAARSSFLVHSILIGEDEVQQLDAPREIVEVGRAAIFGMAASE
jgi:hypothetical protein